MVDCELINITKMQHDGVIAVISIGSACLIANMGSILAGDVSLASVAIRKWRAALLPLIQKPWLLYAVR